MLVISESSARQAYAILVYKVAEVFAVAVVYGLRHIFAVRTHELCKSVEREIRAAIFRGSLHHAYDFSGYYLLSLLVQVARVVFCCSVVGGSRLSFGLVVLLQFGLQFAYQRAFLLEFGSGVLV